MGLLGSPLKSSAFPDSVHVQKDWAGQGTSLLMTAHPPAEYLPSRRFRTRRQVTGREKRSRVDRQGAKLLSGLGFQGGKLCFQLSVGGENGGWLDLGWVECQSPISGYQ